MLEYRAEFLTHGNHVFGTAHFHASDDRAAIDHANVALKTNIGIGHQIWQNDRLVHREIYLGDA